MTVLSQAAQAATYTPVDFSQLGAIQASSNTEFGSDVHTYAKAPEGIGENAPEVKLVSIMGNSGDFATMMAQYRKAGDMANSFVENIDAELALYEGDDAQIERCADVLKEFDKYSSLAAHAAKGSNADDEIMKSRITYKIWKLKGSTARFEDWAESNDKIKIKLSQLRKYVEIGNPAAKKYWAFSYLGFERLVHLKHVVEGIEARKDETIDPIGPFLQRHGVYDTSGRATGNEIDDLKAGIDILMFRADVEKGIRKKCKTKKITIPAAMVLVPSKEMVVELSKEGRDNRLKYKETSVATSFVKKCVEVIKEEGKLDIDTQLKSFIDDIAVVNPAKRIRERTINVLSAFNRLVKKIEGQTSEIGDKDIHDLKLLEPTARWVEKEVKEILKTAKKIQDANPDLFPVS